jgi:hypothetical protein
MQAAQEVLSGLTRPVLTAADLKAALLDGGSAATLVDLKQRFEEYLSGLTRGQDPGRVRIVVE